MRFHASKYNLMVFKGKTFAQFSRISFLSSTPSYRKESENWQQKVSTGLLFSNSLKLAHNSWMRDEFNSRFILAWSAPGEGSYEYYIMLYFINAKHIIYCYCSLHPGGRQIAGQRFEIRPNSLKRGRNKRSLRGNATSTSDKFLNDGSPNSHRWRRPPRNVIQLEVLSVGSRFDSQNSVCRE